MDGMARKVVRGVVLAGYLLLPPAFAGHFAGGPGGPHAGLGAPAGLAMAAVAVSQSETKEPWLRVTITEAERTVLVRHKDELVALGESGKKKKRLPPGLAKKLAKGGELPPGWQKKVARGEVMDQDLYGLTSRVPRHIIRELPKQPTGTVLVVLEGKIVRLIQATREILDVFDLH